MDPDTLKRQFDEKLPRFHRLKEEAQFILDTALKEKRIKILIRHFGDARGTARAAYVNFSKISPGVSSGPTAAESVTWLSSREAAAPAIRR